MSFPAKEERDEHAKCNAQAEADNYAAFPVIELLGFLSVLILDLTQLTCCVGNLERRIPVRALAVRPNVAHHGACRNTEAGGVVVLNETFVAFVRYTLRSDGKVRVWVEQGVSDEFAAHVELFADLLCKIEHGEIPTRHAGFYVFYLVGVPDKWDTCQPGNLLNLCEHWSCVAQVGGSAAQ